MNKFHNCDCMEYMKTVSDKFFELAIVDPPYGIKWDGENLSMSKGLRKDGSCRHDKSWRSKSYKQKYKRKSWDTKPNKLYFDELFRISKNQIIWGGNYFHEFLENTGGWIIWDKKKPKCFSLSDAEIAWSKCKNSIKIFRWLWHGYSQEDIKNKEHRIHPTQKPVALYRWLLQNYAKPGDKIFDSHVGSASSIIACIEEKHDYVGCELDKDYYEAASERIRIFKEQLRLF